MTNSQNIILEDDLALLAEQDALQDIAWVHELLSSYSKAHDPAYEAERRLADFTETLPTRYRMYTYATLREHSGNRAAIEAARQLDGSTNLYLWGAAGNGKTHLAIAIAHERAKNQRVAFWSIPALFQRLRWAALGEASCPDLLGPDTLVLDDIGKIKGTEFVFQELYRIVEERWSNERSTVFTANHRPSEAAARIIDDTPSQGALTSRFAAGRVVEVRGEDERVVAAVRGSSSP